MNYKFTEIFNINELRELCESFTQINKTVTALVDLEGNVHIATGWQDICTLYHRKDEKCSKRCTVSDTLLAGKINDGEKYNVYKCKNGLIDIAIPIYVRNEHVGNFFTGQFLFEKPEKSYFQNQAKEFGFNEKEYLEALDKIPIFTENEIKKSALFLVNLAETIGNTSILAFELNEKTRELEIEKEKVEKSEAHLRTLIKTLPDLIWLKDVNGVYLNCNQRFEDFFGATEKEILGKTDFDFMDKELANFFRANDEAAMKAGKPTVNEEEITFACDGHKEYLETIKTPLYSNDNQLIGVLGIGRNMSIRKKHEEQIIDAKKQAQESDKLKTAFLQNLSHEIRTPLNAICGFSGMLDKPELSEEKRKSFTTIIKDNSNQLLSIVSDILTISSLETLQEKINIEKVCVNTLLIEQLAFFKQQSINHSISLYAKQSLTDFQTEIFTDKTKLTQILSNLISNALKFTHKGFIEFGYLLKNNELEFYVKDSGIGINPEFKQKIFERFRQADISINKKYGGTGLGLAISKGFAELLGGKIWVDSEINKGSTFYFTIPYKLANPEQIIQQITYQTNNKSTILVAEDEEYNFLFLEEILIDLNYKLIHAKDGQETLDIFKNNQDISLILMDIKMPIIDGHTVAKIIKELNPEIPIIAQSAYALEHERAKYEGIFDDYLTKPIKEELLIEKIKKYLPNV